MINYAEIREGEHPTSWDVYRRRIFETTLNEGQEDEVVTTTTEPTFEFTAYSDSEVAPYIEDPHFIVHPRYAATSKSAVH